MSWDRPSDQFLVYLERLSQACLEHDANEIDTLLRLRLASHLPRQILDELEFFRRAKDRTHRAPLRILRHLHKMRHLAAAAPDPRQLLFPLRDATRSLPQANGASRRRAGRRR